MRMSWCQALREGLICSSCRKQCQTSSLRVCDAEWHQSLASCQLTKSYHSQRPSKKPPAQPHNLNTNRARVHSLLHSALSTLLVHAGACHCTTPESSCPQHPEIAGPQDKTRRLHPIGDKKITSNWSDIRTWVVVGL